MNLTNQTVSSQRELTLKDGERDHQAIQNQAKYDRGDMAIEQSFNQTAINS